MKTERNIFVAFLLNLCFAIFEFVGGIFTGSVAILSDSLHDVGDAFSIGMCYFFEKHSKKRPDENFTYGYARYSVVASFIATLILLIGSFFMIATSIHRLINPSTINYDGMIIFAIIGVVVNFIAAFFTREKGSLNQKAVNLHMLEDVLGWIVVLIGAIVMRFTDFYLLDPILSIAVALFILVSAIRNVKSVINLLLEKTPDGISITHLKEHILEMEGVDDVHDIHVWNLDDNIIFATLHLVCSGDGVEIKKEIRKQLAEHNICHVTIEIEKDSDACNEKTEHFTQAVSNVEHHHHHHHHH